MLEPPRSYPAPPDLSPESLQARFEGVLRLKQEPEVVSRRDIYDSFDWRLYAAGKLLEAVTAQRETRLQLRAIGAWELSAILEAKKVPRFVWDLPESSLRRELGPVVEMRALLPRLRVHVSQHVFRVLDDSDKTIVRLLLETGVAEAPDDTRREKLQPRLTLLPLKGYRKAAHQAQAFLENDLGLEVSSEEPVIAALEAVGVRPGAYSSKISVPLDPAIRADTALKKVLLDLLETLEDNVDGTRKDIDSEFLHDLRVATRRTRSALTQVKGVLPPDETEHFKQEFAWVGQITGPTRDMDVYLLKFPGYRDSLPEALSRDLDPLRDFLLAHHRKEQRKLARQFDSARFHKLLQDWRTFLDAPAPEEGGAPEAARTVLEVASKRIYKMYRRVMKEGLAITPDSPAEDLHEIRKSCKKLRYLIEFFKDIYNKKRVNMLVKQLKSLLDNLGDFQDLEVQAQHLHHFAEQMMQEGNAPAGTLMAMGVLIEGLHRRQQEEREAFAERFEQFAAAENQAVFKALFKWKPAAA